MKMSLAEIAQAIQAHNQVDQWGDIEVRSVAFDSRNLEAGGLFVPLKGEQDGHQYVAKALKTGRKRPCGLKITLMIPLMGTHGSWLMTPLKLCNNWGSTT